MPARLTSKDWAILATLSTVAGVLRIAGANRDLWLDEVVTVVRYLRLPPLETLSTYISPNQHLLYSLFGSISIHVLGEQPWSARLPALVFGIVSPAATYFFVRTFGTRREALLTTLLLAVSYHHVWFSQNARGYAPMIFWTVLGSALLVRGVRSGERRAWIGYVICMIAATGFLLNAAFVTLGNCAAVIVYCSLDRCEATSRRRLRRAAMLSLLAIGAGSLLLYAAVLDDVIRFFVEADRTGFGSGISGPGEFAGLFIDGLRRGFGGTAVAVIATLAVLSAGLYDTWRRQPLIALIAIGGPCFGAAAILLLRYGAYPRAFLYFLPPALLFIVRGCDLIGPWLYGAISRVPATPGIGAPSRSQRPGDVLVIAAIVLSFVSLGYNYRYPKQDFSGALRWAEQQAGENDLIAAAGMAGFVYRELHDPDIVALETTEGLDMARQRAATVWVLYSFPRDMRLRFDELFDAIERDGELKAVFPGTAGDGALYVSAVPSSAARRPD